LKRHARTAAFDDLALLSGPGSDVHPCFDYMNQLVEQPGLEPREAARSLTPVREARFVVGMVFVLVVRTVFLRGLLPFRRLDLRSFEQAKRILRQAEQAFTALQNIRCRVHGRPLVVGAWFVLETDNVHRWRVQLNDELLLFQRDVDRHIAVLVRGMLLEFFGVWLGVHGGACRDARQEDWTENH